MKKVILILFLLISQSSFPQIKYVNVNFTNGMPNNLILKWQLKLKWQSAENTEINIGSYYKNLFIVIKDTNSINDLIYYSLGFKNGAVDLSETRMTKVDSDEYTAQFNFKTETEDELSPLNLKIFPKKKLLEYIWGDSVHGYSFEPKIIQEYNLKPGEMFPSLTIESSKGRLNINSYKGKVIVINYWATSCMPCREEIPGLNKLVEKYKNKPVVFLSIIDDKENLGKFLKEYPFEYKQFYSNDDAEKLLGETFPRNIIIGKNHKIIFNKLGGFTGTWKILDKIIEKNL